MSPEGNTHALELRIEQLVEETAQAIVFRGQSVEVDAPPFAYHPPAHVVEFYEGLKGPYVRAFKINLEQTLRRSGFSLVGPFRISILEIRRNQNG